MTAMPTAPPNCCAVLKMPEAPPAAPAGTAARTTLASGMMSRESPAPATTRPGTIDQGSLPVPTPSAPSATASVPRGEQHGTRSEHEPAETLRERDRDGGEHEAADAEGDGGQPGGDGRETPPALQPDREDEEEPLQPRGEGELHRQAGAEGRDAEQPRPQERRNSGVLATLLDDPQRREDGQAAREDKHTQAGQPRLRPSSSG